MRTLLTILTKIMISAYGKGPLPLPPHGDPQRSHHIVVVHERVHKAVPKAAGDDRHEPVRKKTKKCHDLVLI